MPRWEGGRDDAKLLAAVGFREMSQGRYPIHCCRLPTGVRGCRSPLNGGDGVEALDSHWVMRRSLRGGN